ncbi:hypothetical protein ACIRS1_25460 [Kitasatospora sp. NPDC101176]|uniref:hypothetical protein n=1 Tax=Kitasatospora sp. NPDC101176 TaxID=3364099 RepID=UPI00380CA1A6
MARAQVTTQPDHDGRLYLGHLERGSYVDRLVRVGETTALTDPFHLDLDPAVLRRPVRGTATAWRPRIGEGPRPARSALITGRTLFASSR